MIRMFSAGVAFAVVAISSPGLAVHAGAGQAGSPPMHELTFAEVKAQADRVWNRLDANHDGRIDRADRDARLLEYFAMADTNHDGVISKDEFLAAMRAREAKWEEHGHNERDRDELGPPGPPPPGAPQDFRPDVVGGGMGDGPNMAMAIIGPALHGARTDGVITRAAFDTALKARFDAIDVNHDGSLSQEELRAARHDGPHQGWKKRDHGMRPPPPGTGE
jgi:hypothetical protein